MHKILHMVYHFMKIANRVTQSTLPCGIPQRLGPKDYIFLSILYSCDISLSQILNSLQISYFFLSFLTTCLFIKMGSSFFFFLHNLICFLHFMTYKLVEKMSMYQYITLHWRASYRSPESTVYYPPLESQLPITREYSILPVVISSKIVTIWYCGTGGAGNNSGFHSLMKYLGTLKYFEGEFHALYNTKKNSHQKMFMWKKDPLLPHHPLYQMDTIKCPIESVVPSSRILIIKETRTFHLSCNVSFN